MSETKTPLLVIRVRGLAGIRRDIEDNMQMLHLVRLYHAVLIPQTPSYIGMIRKSKDYITWGEPTLETLEALLEKRGRLVGNKRLTEEYLKENTEFKSISDLAKAIYEGKIKPDEVPGLKPVFRLRPPKKGFRGKKMRAYKNGGITGYRGSAINELAQRMI